MTQLQMSPGGVAEYLQIPFAQARAAIAAAGLLDERGRPKKWFTAGDCEGPIRAALTLTDTMPAPARDDSPAADTSTALPRDEDEGEPEPVSAEDIEKVERQLGRPVETHGRRRKR